MKVICAPKKNQGNQKKKKENGVVPLILFIVSRVSLIELRVPPTKAAKLLLLCCVFFFFVSCVRVRVALTAV